MRRSVWIVLLCAVVAGILFYYFHKSGDDSGSGGKHGKGGSTAPVGVAAAHTGDIDVYLSGLGNVTPRSTVTVNTRVSGELMKVDFKEGQLVKKDQPLAEIDARPFQAVLEQAQGQMTRDEALLKEARIDLVRYQTLFKQDSIAKQQLDTQTSLVKQYEGAVQNDKGLVDSAKTNLIYTRITSPVSGRVGLRLVDPGNIVNTGTTSGIVVVTELQPITVIFTLPEDSIQPVLQHFQSGTLHVTAFDRDGKNQLAEGKLAAIDNQVDPTTGTVRLRAEFPNKDNALFPSQFVNARLLLDTKHDVVLMPTAGVQRGSQGTFVYLVKDAADVKDEKKADKTTDEKKEDKAPREGKVVVVTPITLGTSEGESVEVTKGLSAGDQVVVDGGDALHDGAKIDVAPPKTPDTGAPAPAKDPTDKDKADTSQDKAHHKHKKPQQSE